MRDFNGTNQSLSRTGALLSGWTAGFTVTFCVDPDDTTADQYLFQNVNGGSEWGVLCGFVNGQAEFYHGAGGALRTSSGINLTIGARQWITYRSKGSGGEWAKFKDSVKTVINASLAFTLPTTAGGTIWVGRAGAGSYFNGRIAEISVCSVALHDEQIEELHAGVAADRIVGPGGLLFYCPLRGNSSPERNYAIPADTLTLNNAPAAAAHPDIVPPLMADSAEEAWVVDFFHPNGTVRVASTDLRDDVDLDILGAPYPSLLIGDITVSEEDAAEQPGGVMLPGQTVITINNALGAINTRWQWRQCPVRARMYDKRHHALRTEFRGVVLDPSNLADEQVVFTCGGQDEQLLATLVPRQVIEVADPLTGVIDDIDATERRSDLGAPIPIAMGVGGVCLLPYLATNRELEDDNAHFLVGWGTGVRVTGVWWEFDLDKPGLDPVTLFRTAPGTPTSATTTTFTVTGDQSRNYAIDNIVRRSGDGGLTWSYSEVASYSSGTVTLKDAILPASPAAIGLMEMSQDGVGVERARWKFEGAATTPLTSLYFHGDEPTTAVVAELADAAMENPAAALQFVLENDDQGLGQTANAAAWSKAFNDFVAAGLGAAIKYVLGGDRAQRRFLDFANEILALRGGDMWRDPETGEWMVEIDTAPRSIRRTLAFGHRDPVTKTYKNDIAEVLSVSDTPLGQAVATMALRYGPGGRTDSRLNFQQQPYNYRARMTVLPGLAGVEDVIDSQLLRDHNAARRVLYYRGKRRQRADRTIRFRMMHNGWRVKRGEVYPFLIPGAGVEWLEAPGTPTSATTTTFTVTGNLSALYLRTLAVRRSGDGGVTWSTSCVASYSQAGPTGTVTLENAILPASPTAIGLVEVTPLFRVTGRTRSLGDHSFVAKGPYHSDIYETDGAVIGAVVSQPTDLAEPEERSRPRGSGGNLALNADFSTGLKRAALAAAPNDVDILPHWTVVSPANVTSLAVTADSRARGGYYLTYTTGGGTSSLLNHGNDLANSCPAVTEGVVYLPSIYLSSNVPGGAGVGWHFRIFWLNAAGGIEGTSDLPNLFIVPGDINGFGAARYYGKVRVPTGLGIVYAAAGVRFLATGRIFTLDGWQFEETPNAFTRPSEWTRNPRYGLHPTSMQAGEQRVLADNEPEHGNRSRVKKGTNFDTGGVTLSGTKVVLGTAGPGKVHCVTARVTQQITGCTSWTLALDDGVNDPVPVATGLALAATTTVGDAEQITEHKLQQQVNIVAIPVGGAASFSGGKIKASAHERQHIAPTS